MNSKSVECCAKFFFRSALVTLKGVLPPGILKEDLKLLLEFFGVSLLSGSVTILSRCEDIDILLYASDGRLATLVGSRFNLTSFTLFFGFPTLSESEPSTFMSI